MKKLISMLVVLSLLMVSVNVFGMNYQGNKKVESCIETVINVGSNYITTTSSDGNSWVIERCAIDKNIRVGNLVQIFYSSNDDIVEVHRLKLKVLHVSHCNTLFEKDVYTYYSYAGYKFTSTKRYNFNSRNYLKIVAVNEDNQVVHIF